jgi:5-methylcytosine-specific restriction protein A
MKLKMLQPRLATLDPAKARGLKMVEDLPRRVNGYLVTKPTRWTKADNGRVLPLNSAAWRTLRASVLADKPLCEYCPPGVITPANTVDHKNNNPADNTRANLVSCCVPCHSLKTASDMHGRPARLGCDAEGNPIGSDHHWNQRAVGPSDGLQNDVTASQEIASG